MTNPVYHLRLPIAIDTEDGQRRIDAVEVSGARTRFRRTVTGRVKRLVLDPAGDFMLQAADSGSHPWSVEVLAIIEPGRDLLHLTDRQDQRRNHCLAATKPPGCEDR